MSTLVIGMRELSMEETEQVSGGWWFLVPVALNLAARHSGNALVRHIIVEVGLGVATYSAAVKAGEYATRKREEEAAEKP